MDTDNRYQLQYKIWHAMGYLNATKHNADYFRHLWRLTDKELRDLWHNIQQMKGVH